MYNSFIENVPDPKDRLLIDPPIELRDLEQRFAELDRWISKESIINQQLEFFTEIQQREIRKNVNTKNLKKLFTTLTPKLREFYQKINSISGRKRRAYDIGLLIGLDSHNNLILQLDR